MVVWGLVAFAAVSSVGGPLPGMTALILVRFGQGAAAAAFSPVASAAVGRLASPAARGRCFGRYGSWKSLGYAAGPVVGAPIATIGGQGLLQTVLALLGAAAVLWAAAGGAPSGIGALGVLLAAAPSSPSRRDVGASTRERRSPCRRGAAPAAVLAQGR